MRGLALISALTMFACGGTSGPASEPTPAVETEPAAPAAPPPPPGVAPWVAPPPRPDVVEVLKQVPQAATFVAGLDVARMSRGALANRFRSMMALIVAFAPPSCATLSVDHFDRVVAAGVGTNGEHVVFLGPALEERVVGPCLATATMKKNNVSIVQRKELGTTVYTSSGPGAGDDALAWTPRSGPIIADRQDWVLATLDPQAPKATPELVALASSADHGRMLWLAAQVDVADLAGFPMPPNTVTGPFTLRVGIDLDDTADVDVDLVFSSTADPLDTQRRRVLVDAALEVPDGVFAPVPLPGERLAGRTVGRDGAQRDEERVAEPSWHGLAHVVQDRQRAHGARRRRLLRWLRIEYVVAVDALHAGDEPVIAIADEQRHLVEVNWHQPRAGHVVHQPRLPGDSRSDRGPSDRGPGRSQRIGQQRSCHRTGVMLAFPQERQERLPDPEWADFPVGQNLRAPAMRAMTCSSTWTTTPASDGAVRASWSGHSLS